ncbi:MAG: outer membrane lipoprotein carrier protein LolA [Candidatus Schekmanbacteria bacterium RIFCSPHIGHO2_02_FULL_38_11]|uniref:Outer-membrane lipoprotein carrier protein n=1 Tax=Candidatus Schekmanbacteria bacterium RIFCSPLOWO2_12_FULL_38_15 TaxID=1817883 RepID=A0A1F7SL33_9BACT|nr:MAG: outer membrane lipoprotein carrier protein LolA [Candidatus Schekmanbacteria bacterium GWA2_38_9]OGL48042.1 MAG: outer membrane lipoprotein carrier protein LolA [Candidatus Schekmanbacteria bacterium RIFCSPLOWO2_02_FULL_38_14]OGL50706.1 MAG: outer membrane lipoprotein carrier protein LolA [Candidatus Schekmanbacteria bacterium RIFCSPHIGHO2_02_FULL_38_11]OGL54473.1 MAG: outer membrane lipoprotein carrier protein LolA [Candidatus Schekmanbacteria bacterium RIFCSPLOWO2_12_FULL_38_15]
MKYILIKPSGLFLYLLILNFILPEPVYPETSALDEIVSKIQKKYEYVRELETDCIQETFNRTVEKKFIFKGSLYVKKPDKLRMEIKEPEKQLIIANGQTLWVYLPENKQVVREKLDLNNKSKTALTILTGMAKLSRDFEISMEQGSEKSRSYMLGLIPKDSKSMIKKMRLEVDKNNLNFQKVIVEDSFGNWTSYELKNIKVNRGISDSKFEFKTPDGVEVVESTGD